MTAHSADTIEVTRDGAVATVWLARPDKRNAMSYAMWAGLEQAALQLGSDSTVRVVVLRGRGEHFCAGADITELGVQRGDGERSFADVNLAAEAALATLAKPTVAFIDGDCIGGGAALAIDCDLRLATFSARFGITPAKLGIVYPAASLERAVQLLGPSVTKGLLFTGELIDAAEALRVGLVNELVDAAAAEARLAALTGVLATRSLVTQSATKEMVAAIAASGGVSESLLDRWATRAAAAEDGAEGVAAFVEKRSPNFTWTGINDV